MFCLCCRPSGGFFAEGVAEPVLDFARALKRHTAYERRTRYSSAPATHPAPSEFVVRNTNAITMDPHIGNLTEADIHVRDGAIVNLGCSLQTSAFEIAGSDLTALPGLIADHRHLVSEIAPAADAHRTSLQDMEPQDIYRALRLWLLDLVSTGVTCVHVCGIDIGSDHAETAVLAQIDSGYAAASAIHSNRKLLTTTGNRSANCTKPGSPMPPIICSISASPGTKEPSGNCSLFIGSR